MSLTRRSMLQALSGSGGGNVYTFTKYTVPSNQSFNTAFNAANIPLASQNEVLIWNIKGTHQQGSGTVGGKCGIICIQNGTVVSNYAGYKRMTSIVAPDLSSPANSWQALNTQFSIVDGHYRVTTSAIFHVGGGNTLEFIQIPYDMGWAMS